jgi:predicted Holliday junction resolvase-like endonuclease
MKTIFILILSIAVMITSKKGLKNDVRNVKRRQRYAQRKQAKNQEHHNREVQKVLKRRFDHALSKKKYRESKKINDAREKAKMM